MLSPSNTVEFFFPGGMLGKVFLSLSLPGWTDVQEKKKHFFGGKEEEEAVIFGPMSKQPGRRGEKSTAELRYKTNCAGPAL